MLILDRLTRQLEPYFSQPVSENGLLGIDTPIYLRLENIRAAMFQAPEGLQFNEIHIDLNAGDSSRFGSVFHVYLPVQREWKSWDASEGPLKLGENVASFQLYPSRFEVSATLATLPVGLTFFTDTALPLTQSVEVNVEPLPAFEVSLPTTVKADQAGQFRIQRSDSRTDALITLPSGEQIATDFSTTSSIDFTKSYRDVVLKDNPVVYYSFDESADATVVADLAAGLNATPHNVKLGDASAKGLGSAVSFGASDRYVEPMQQIPNAFGQGSHTFEAWIKVDRATEFGGFVLTNYQNGSTPAIDYEIYTGGKLRILWGESTNYVEYSGSTDLRDDRWHLLTVVRDKDTNRFSAYVDGGQESLTPVHGSGIGPDIDLSSLSRLRIGADARDEVGARPFQGSMDELAFYDRALSAEEIKRRVLAANRVNPQYLNDTDETFVIDTSNGPVDFLLSVAAGKSGDVDTRQNDAIRVDGSGVTIALQKAIREGESIISAENSGLVASTLSRIDSTIDGIDYIDLRGDGPNALTVSQFQRSTIVDAGILHTSSISGWSSSGEQNVNGWSFGYYDQTTDTDGVYQSTDFQAFTSPAWIFRNDHWDNPTGLIPWTDLGPIEGHPNGDNNSNVHLAIRRWTSNVTGTATIEYHVAKANIGCGNGTTVILFQSGQELGRATVASNDANGKMQTVQVDISRGDVFDLALSPLGSDGTLNDNCDGSNYDMSINVDLRSQVATQVIDVARSLAEIIVDNDPVTRTLHVLRDQDDVINFQDGSDNWTKLDGTEVVDGIKFEVYTYTLSPGYQATLKLQVPPPPPIDRDIFADMPFEFAGDTRHHEAQLLDVDRDGDLDAVFAGGRSLEVWKNDGAGRFTKFYENTSISDIYYVAHGDIDGDEDEDLVLARNGGNVVLYNVGDGSFVYLFQQLGNSFSIDAKLGDLDGDGDLDLFVANTNGQPNRIWINSDGRGRFVDSPGVWLG
ncbi:MAG: LamG domain-containing protein [Planctomycetales bacterium]|nr:LamG domain-containing protein [Planctomycetales bacterium]